MALSADIARFGTDLRLSETEDEILQVTASGDIPSQSGRENLRSAIRRRILTAPGELVHRPEYGCGLLLYLERPLTPAVRSQLANAIRSNILRDSRVRDVKVAVVAGLPDDPTASQAVTVTLSYRPADDIETDTMTVEYAA